MQNLNTLVLDAPPPLDPVWLAHEEATGLRSPRPAVTAVARQPVYAAECRARNAAMMAPSARDHSLAKGIRVQTLTTPSGNGDGFEIPVLLYQLEEDGGGAQAVAADTREDTILIYIHGGGLLVGEADSEELTCRRIIKHFPQSPGTSAGAKSNVKLYSIGYRLMPQVTAPTCVSDVLSAFGGIRQRHPSGRLVLIGSSSGGELAALLSQSLPPDSLAGILLRCPVTADAPAHVPSRFQGWHTSAAAPFTTSLLGFFDRQCPRDGLERMPLEMPVDEVRGLRMPRTWIQVCSNDVLFSDGVCYAKLLQDAGVEVKVDVIEGWPHTFWLKAPHLDRALQVDEAMLDGLAWIAG